MWGFGKPPAQHRFLLVVVVVGWCHTGWFQGAVKTCQQDGTEWLANNILGNEVALSKPAIRRWMVFAFGRDAAASLGINIKHIRVILLSFTALIAADIVANAGAIRFIDLVIPHPCRMH